MKGNTNARRNTIRVDDCQWDGEASLRLRPKKSQPRTLRETKPQRVRHRRIARSRKKDIDSLASKVMFERYSEKARRVVFFARYEASQYGSPYIETEHLLLGLLREDRALTRMVLGLGNVDAEIRAEIERHITRSEPIPTAVEVPLTAESKKILNLAAEEADGLAQRHVGTEHMLLAMFRVEGSLAGQILRARGAKPSPPNGRH